MASPLDGLKEKVRPGASGVTIRGLEAMVEVFLIMAEQMKDAVDILRDVLNKLKDIEEVLKGS